MAVGKSAKTVRKSNFQDIQGFNDFKDAKATTITGVTLDTANPKKWTVKMAKVSCPAIIQLIGYVLPTQVFGKYVTATSKPEDIDNAPENTNPTVFSGPFTFKEWRKGDQVILGKNTTYWQGAPNVDEYVVKVLANQTAITNGLKTGELTFGTIPAKDLADMQTVDSVTITKYQNLGYTFIGWNTASPSAVGLADKRVRQALAYGIDMDAVIKAVVFGEATKQVAHHVPVQWAYPSVALEPYKYDKAKAQQLLKDAGWTPGSDGMLVNAAGKKFNLTISTNSGNQERETLAQVAADQYNQRRLEARGVPGPRDEAHYRRSDARGDDHRLEPRRRPRPVPDLALEPDPEPGDESRGLRLHVLQGPGDGQGDRAGAQPDGRQLLDGRSQGQLRDVQQDPEREPAVQLRVLEQRAAGLAEVTAELRTGTVPNRVQRRTVVDQEVTRM